MTRPDNASQNPELPAAAHPQGKYEAQQKQRLNYMPWLYWSLKPKLKAWAQAWQAQWQAYLTDMETVHIEGEVFISPEAQLFAEPGRAIHIRDGSFIGANAVLHGPIDIGRKVGINHHCQIDGGKKGIVIGDECRIAAYCSLIAFNHRYDMAMPISEQGINSKGITLGKDIWLGTHTAVVDGVTIGDKAVVGMRSVVTKDIAANTVAAGNPAKSIKQRP
ncbi:acyltransferase [Agaribacterium haliotis]|uniref:acyltransferase n=1 Tax=Agaribacterium haliotis TaxID=2013869 RepID=UPI0011773AB6|nr:acyltransferase [Agaribacterium haliotis]